MLAQRAVIRGRCWYRGQLSGGGVGTEGSYLGEVLAQRAVIWGKCWHRGQLSGVSVGTEGSYLG